MEDAGATAEPAEDSRLDHSVYAQEFCTWDTQHLATDCAGVSDAVSVAEFKAQCAKHLEIVESDSVTRTVSSMPPGPVRDFGLTEMMGISIAELEAVKRECDTEKLLSAHQIESILKIRASNLPKDSPLKSTRNPDAVKKVLLLGSGQSYNKGNVLPTTPPQTLENRARDKELESEIVLTMLVFHPVVKRPDQQFHVLSSQPLTALRDKILCPCDYFITHDFSDNLESFETHYESLPGPPNPSPSAFFFIDNTFYSDLRHPHSTEDRVREIIDWSNSQDRGEPSRQPRNDFTMKNMEDVKFNELTVRLGYPYLFCHHGNCEHLLVFADLRLYNTSIDRPARSDYPFLVYKHKVKTRLCSLCSSEPVKWVTEEDELAPESPSFFCRDCFKKLHYSKDNRKLCHFKAYPYKATV